MKNVLYTPYAGPNILDTCLLNKGSAFSLQERKDFNLIGLLPLVIENITEQVKRCFEQYTDLALDIEKHIYLRNLQDTNETLFYALIDKHLTEMLPIIYTPTVGDACQYFSSIYRRARGLFCSYPDKEFIEDIIFSPTKRKVKIIVITDGERILGLGDQGIGGIGIPIGKLSLYTVCGGISPAYTMPIMIDVGTNNKILLEDPLYMGWRHKRITGNEYYNFIDKVISSIKKRWPKVILQFEDFAQQKANYLLNIYKNKICSFNDDIQGTAAVALGTLLSACNIKKEKLTQQKILFIGSGSAGCGIAALIVKEMISQGLDEKQAYAQIFLVNSRGLLIKNNDILDFQQDLAKNKNIIKEWNIYDKPSIIDIINNAKPTVIIGVSGIAGLINQEMIKRINKYCQQPIIFPLSNPTSKSEAKPQDLLEWTNGQAIIATGSPFDVVRYNNKNYHIAQCNNCYIFPGVGLGVIACNAKRISDNMFVAAAHVLAVSAPNSLLPKIEDIKKLSKKIAFVVAKKAMAEKLAPFISDELLQQNINDNFWNPEYRPYKRRVAL